MSAVVSRVRSGRELELDIVLSDLLENMEDVGEEGRELGRLKESVKVVEELGIDSFPERGDVGCRSVARSVCATSEVSVILSSRHSSHRCHCKQIGYLCTHAFL